MNARIFCGGILAAALLFPGSHARAGDSIFLQLPGIPGASQDAAHPNWIVATSMEFGAEKSQGADAAFGDLAIGKSVDNASPLLAQFCAAGTYIPSATVQVTATNLLVYQIRLDNAWITGETQNSTTSDTSEAVTIRFGKISWTYQQTTTSWDLLYGKTPIYVGASGAQAAGSGVMNLTWTVSAGATYNLFGSSQVNGPYALVESFTATNLGATTITVPATNSMFFYRVQELP